ncbi:nucleotidyl transferase AbiEii/AbiGii toxin family protein [Candidatus Gottesmanbacteria bacterium]|nr:nucleotidyl transferase AbiEii/AbiGii toxin family protein [Candidatus Gottesmanbacteria bacterium]
MFTKTLSGDAQKSLAILGKNVLPKGTYMAGGSALALYFGHRISVDFDFFTPISFSSSDLAKKLNMLGKFKTQTALSDTLLGTFNDIKFSIFKYNYPLIFPTQNFLGIKLAHPEDIGAMKIAAIMDRGSKKDFIDLYFLSQRGINLEECFNIYNKKYKALGNNLYSIITSLSYFVDAEVAEMPIMLLKVNWEEVKAFFRKEAVRLGKKYLQNF